MGTEIKPLLILRGKYILLLVKLVQSYFPVSLQARKSSQVVESYRVKTQSLVPQRPKGIQWMQELGDRGIRQRTR